MCQQGGAEAEAEALYSLRVAPSSSSCLFLSQLLCEKPQSDEDTLQTLRTLWGQEERND